MRAIAHIGQRQNLLGQTLQLDGIGMAAAPDGGLTGDGRQQIVEDAAFGIEAGGQLFGHLRQNERNILLAQIGGRAADGTARMGCLHDAEALLLEDHVLTPLYNKGTDWEIRDGLTGICRDARGWFSFSGIVKASA